MPGPTPHSLRFAVLATDVIAFRLHKRELEVLLIPVIIPEYLGMQGLPGGLIKPEETAEQAALRVLTDKGGLIGTHLEQLYTFSDVDRDPRGRVVSVAYLALMAPGESEVRADSAVRWCPIRSLPTLAYDHTKIVALALERLRARIEYTTIIRHLLSREFTLTELQEAYESILEHPLDKRNFRKKILALGLISETGRKRTQGASRPAELYQFAHKGVRTIEIL